MNIEEKLNLCADNFSTNKATNKAYHRIFELIYQKNVIERANNDFGFAEIHSSLFKKISKRKYNEILQDLYKNELIFTNVPLNLGRAFGLKTPGGDKIIRGYKIDWNLEQSPNDPQFQVKNLEVNSLSQSHSILFHSTIPFHPFVILYTNTGEHFLKSGNYDILTIYNYIQLDQNSIPYSEGSPEWNELAKKWNKHTKAYKNGNRIFSWFHSIHSSERSIFMLNDSHLRECFDVPACNFCIIAKMLEDQDVNQDELKQFQTMIKTDYIYRCIAQSMGLDIKIEVIKKNIKKSCQHWLNIRKRYKHNGSRKDEYFNGIDQFFQTKFPSIYTSLLNWREAEHNGKKTKMLWFDFQKVEYEIMSKKICTYLHKTYGVLPLTVHDAIYLTDADMKQVKEPIEEIFWRELDLKYA